MRIAGGIAVGIVMLVACVGDDPAPGAGGSTSSGGASSSGATTSSSGGSSGTSGGSSGTTSSGSSGTVCTAGAKSCEADKLKTCKANAMGFDSVTCAAGCIAAPTPHCKTIVPSANGVTSADLDSTDLMPTIITVSTTLNTDTGEITNGVRAANADASTREVKSGIAFHVVDIPGATGKKMGVFSFADFTIGDGKNVVATGKNALAIVSAGEVKILGTLDMRGTCANAAGGPGGGDGAKVGVAASGDTLGVGKNGVSNSSDMNCGGSGGGFGDNGGNTGGIGSNRSGGVAYGNATLVPLVGGSGGGRGGDGNSALASTGGNGGGGGGAVQIVAANKITIGGSASIGGINAGGCGGQGGSVPAGMNNSGNGGGGGSGGAILLEAPEVKLDTFGELVANGGAGGGGAIATGSGATAQAGTNGAFTWNQTQFHQSAAAGSGCGAGGFGGATNDTSTDPDSTNKGENGYLGGSGYCGGGAGGGVGRIRVNSTSGAMIIVDASGKVSPKFDDVTSHADKAATQGKIVVE